MQQSRIDPGSLRQASMMTGAHPVSPSRQSYQPSDRQVNPGAIQSRVGNQRFFNPASRQNSTFQGGRGDGNFNRGGNPAGNPSGARGYDQSARPGQTGNSGQRGYSGPSSQQGQPVESSRPGWRTFNPPAGRQTQSDGNGRQPNRNDSRGGYNNGSNRPTLDMQQPVVTPRGGGSYSGGGDATPRGDQGNRGSYTGRSMPNAPTDRNNGGGGYRGGPPEGGAYSSRPRPSAPSERGNGGGGYRGGPPEGGAYSGRPVPSAPSERGNGGGGYRGGAPDRGPYPAGRCQARQASAATVVVDIVVAASQVEVPIQGVPCRARRAVAMEEVARGVDPRTVDRMEETPVAVPAADLQVAITATTK